MDLLKVSHQMKQTFVHKPFISPRNNALSSMFKWPVTTRKDGDLPNSRLLRKHRDGLCAIRLCTVEMALGIINHDPRRQEIQTVYALTMVANDDIDGPKRRAKVTNCAPPVPRARFLVECTIAARRA